MKTRNKLTPRTIRFSGEYELARILGPKTVLKTKDALIRQCLQDHLVDTAKCYLRPKQQIVTVVWANGDGDGQ